MTTGRERTPRRRAPRRDAFPALRAFVRGYLHEDYEQEYGSAVAAAAAFREDATEQERRRLIDELTAFRAASEHAPRNLSRLASDIGGRWDPPSLEAIDDLLRALQG